VQKRECAALCLQSFETGIAKLGLAPVQKSEQRSARRTEERRDNEQRGHGEGVPNVVAEKRVTPLTPRDTIVPETSNVKTLHET